MRVYFAGPGNGSPIGLFFSEVGSRGAVSRGPTISSDYAWRRRQGAERLSAGFLPGNVGRCGEKLSDLHFEPKTILMVNTRNGSEPGSSRELAAETLSGFIERITAVRIS
jgi:hypothetical protein